MQGRYLAEITREVFAELESSKYTLAEYRLSVYGKNKSEWSKLAAWVVDNKLFSANVRWMIQVCSSECVRVSWGLQWLNR